MTLPTEKTQGIILKLLGKNLVSTAVSYLRNLKEEQEYRNGLKMIVLAVFDAGKDEEFATIRQELNELEFGDVCIELEDRMCEAVRTGNHQWAIQLCKLIGREISNYELQLMFEFHLERGDEGNFNIIAKMMDQKYEAKKSAAATD